MDCFKKEFEDILKVVIPENPETMASLGYYLRSYQWCGHSNAAKAVGLDIGNAYTIVTQHNVPEETFTANPQVYVHSNDTSLNYP